MVRALLGNFQSQGGEFGGLPGAMGVDARPVGIAKGCDTEVSDTGNQGGFNLLYQLARSPVQSAGIQQHVTDELPGAMPGHLAAAISLDYRNVSRIQDMFLFASTAQRKHRVVFKEPELVGGAGITFPGELLHGCPDGRVGLGFPEVPDVQWASRSLGRHYNTIRTSGCPFRSLKMASSCSMPVAVMVMVMDS